jgi:heme/copper-type cytochrome/quinol oxidase subunit 4
MNKSTFVFARAVFLAGFIILLFLIVYGAVYADIAGEGKAMLDTFWGRFTLGDIYIAFAVFYLWVFYREKAPAKKLLWFVFIMAGGSMAICLYMFLALGKSRGDVNKLLKGGN